MNVWVKGKLGQLMGTQGLCFGESLMTRKGSTGAVMEGVNLETKVGDDGRVTQNAWGERFSHGRVSAYGDEMMIGEEEEEDD